MSKITDFFQKRTPIIVNDDTNPQQALQGDKKMNDGSFYLSDIEGNQHHSNYLQSFNQSEILELFNQNQYNQSQDLNDHYTAYCCTNKADDLDSNIEEYYSECDMRHLFTCISFENGIWATDVADRGYLCDELLQKKPVEQIIDYGVDFDGFLSHFGSITMFNERQKELKNPVLLNGKCIKFICWKDTVGIDVCSTLLKKFYHGLLYFKHQFQFVYKGSFYNYFGSVLGLSIYLTAVLNYEEKFQTNEFLQIEMQQFKDQYDCYNDYITSGDVMLMNFLHNEEQRIRNRIQAEQIMQHGPKINFDDEDYSRIEMINQRNPHEFRPQPSDIFSNGIEELAELTKAEESFESIYDEEVIRLDGNGRIMNFDNEIPADLLLQPEIQYGVGLQQQLIDEAEERDRIQGIIDQNNEEMELQDIIETQQQYEEEQFQQEHAILEDPNDVELDQIIEGFEIEEQQGLDMTGEVMNDAHFGFE